MSPRIGGIEFQSVAKILEGFAELVRLRVHHAEVDISIREVGVEFLGVFQGRERVGPILEFAVDLADL